MSAAAFSQAAIAPSASGISPYLNDILSAERGIAGLGVFGMDAPGAKEDDDDDEHISSSSGDDVDDDIVDDAGAEAVEEEEELIIDPPIIAEEAPVKLARNPADPTSEERERHDATHIPFRQWCPICLEARATEDPHYIQTVEERAQGLPRVCVD